MEEMYYDITVAGVKRRLPLCRLSEELPCNRALKLSA